MQDFNSYNSSKEKGGKNGEKQSGMSGLINLVKTLSRKYDGKSSQELYDAVFSEAKKRKQAGTLSQAEIDNFYKMLYPLLDDKKRKYLYQIVNDLKKI